MVKLFGDLARTAGSPREPSPDHGICVGTRAPPTRRAPAPCCAELLDLVSPRATTTNLASCTWQSVLGITPTPASTAAVASHDTTAGAGSRSRFFRVIRVVGGRVCRTKGVYILLEDDKEGAILPLPCPETASKRRTQVTPTRSGASLRLYLENYRENDCMWERGAETHLLGAESRKIGFRRFHSSEFPSDFRVALCTCAVLLGKAKARSK